MALGQLQESGLDDADIRRMVRRGQLLRLGRGAYLVDPGHDTDRDGRSRSGRGMLLVEADGAEVPPRFEALLTDRARANQLTAMGFDIIRLT